jgi:hypothetical protein
MSPWGDTTKRNRSAPLPRGAAVELRQTPNIAYCSRAVILAWMDAGV